MTFSANKIKDSLLVWEEAYTLSFVQRKIETPLIEWRGDYTSTSGRLGKTVAIEFALPFIAVAYVIEAIVRVALAAIFLITIFITASGYYDCFLSPAMHSLLKVVTLPIWLPAALILQPFREEVSPKLELFEDKLIEFERNFDFNETN